MLVVMTISLSGILLNFNVYFVINHAYSWMCREMLGVATNIWLSNIDIIYYFNTSGSIASDVIV